MKNTPHTPGPWNIDHGNCHIAIIDKNDRNLAFCSLQNEDGDEDKANARLISAAPDLLSALQQMLNADYAIQEGFREKSDQAMLRISAIDSAHRAIAKAKGEA